MLAIPGVMPGLAGHSPFSPGHAAQGREVSLSIEPTGRDVSISGDGLNQAYCAFGLPGVGKTVLLKHVLRQLLDQSADDPDRQPGGLIIDPKGALRIELRDFLARHKRRDALIVINRSELAALGRSVDLLPGDLSEFDLSTYLAKCATAMGGETSENFWQVMLQGVILAVLMIVTRLEGRRPTLSELADWCLAVTGSDEGGANRAPLNGIAPNKAQLFKPPPRFNRAAMDTRLYQLLEMLERSVHDGSAPEALAADLKVARSWLSSHLAGDKRYVIDALINKAFGIFQTSDYACFSDPAAAAKTRSLYESIVHEGKIVLVSADSAGDCGAQMLCALTKTFFQDVIKRRLALSESRNINTTRQCFLLADEYSDVATALSGDTNFGDPHFFQNMRQFKCFAFVFTQSIEGLASGRLANVYKMLLGTISAKIFFKVGDLGTLDYAKELAGQSEAILEFEGGGASGRGRQEYRERSAVPDSLIRNFRKFQAVALGSLDGNDSEANIKLFQVPDPRLG